MEAIVRHPSYDEQDELVRGYCREAEGLIALARSHTEALCVKDEWCTRFHNECKSALVFNAAEKYLDQIIEHQWNSEGHSNDSKDNSH